MATRRSSYLSLITRRELGGLQAIRPPNPLLRRWGMTVPDLHPGERQTTDPEPAHIPTSASSFSAPPISVAPVSSPSPELQRPGRDLLVEPANVFNSEQPVREKKPSKLMGDAKATLMGEATAPDNSVESSTPRPFVRARRSLPETKDPVAQTDAAQITGAPVARVPVDERSATPILLEETTEPPSPSAALSLPTMVVTPLPSSVRNTTDESAKTETAPIKFSPTRHTPEVSSMTEPQPVASVRPGSVVVANHAPDSAPLPPAVAPQLRGRREVTPTTKVPAVHIGSVEVRIVPPAAPPNKPQRAAAGSASSVLLSRGFTTSFGLRQG